MDESDDVPTTLNLIWAIATRTGGSITWHELRAIGFTEGQVRRLCDKGFLRRERRGHYLVGHEALAARGGWNAKVRQAGDGALLGGFASIDCWGFLPWGSSGGRIDVVVPKARRAISGAALSIRPKLVGLGSATCQDVSILSPECAVVHVAERVTSGTVVRLIKEGKYRHLLDVERLEQIASQPYVRGGRTVREAIELWRHGDRGMWSRYERLVNRVLPKDVVEGSVANCVVSVGTEHLTVDRVWGDLGFCLEIDGPPHDEPYQQRIDRIRRAGLTATGKRVFVVHWVDLESDPEAAVRPLVDAVRAGRVAPVARPAQPVEHWSTSPLHVHGNVDESSDGWRVPDFG